jgi:hypothetical protein
LLLSSDKLPIAKLLLLLFKAHLAEVLLSIIIPHCQIPEMLSVTEEMTIQMILREVMVEVIMVVMVVVTVLLMAILTVILVEVMVDHQTMILNLTTMKITPTMLILLSPSTN